MLGIQYFRSDMGRHSRFVPLMPQPVTYTRLRPPCPAPTLLGTGEGYTLRDKRDMPVPASKRTVRAKPESMTTRTPSIVRLVSAMDVASTIFRTGAQTGAMAASCSAAGRSPYSGQRCTVSDRTS